MMHFTILLERPVCLASIFSDVPWSHLVVLLPSLGLFLLGLAVGALFWRRRPQEIVVIDESIPHTWAEQGDVGELKESDGAGDTEGPASTGRVWNSLEGDLAAARLLSDQQSEEIRVLGERIASLREHLTEKNRRVESLSQAIGHAVGLPGVEALITFARLPSVQLGEVLNSECEQIGASLARMERLHQRLCEEEARFEAGAESLTLARGEVGDLLSKPTSSRFTFALAERLAQVDDQMRVLVQNLRGCVSRIGSAREHLQQERSRLQLITQPIREIEQTLSAERATTEAVGPALDEARALLDEARDRILQLQNGVEQEIDEMVGRVDWVVRDSASGFLKALDRLNDANSGADLASSLIESRVWRGLNELKASLSGIQLTLEAGAIAVPAGGCGKRRLLDAIDRAGAALEGARSLSQARESSQAGPAAGPMAEILETLRLETEERDAEIARLREEAARREDELAELRLASRPSGLPTRGKPEGDFAAPLPGLPSAVPAKSGKSRSRLFIRRLLGLGPGQWEADLDAAATMAAPTAVATLAEARAVMTELKQVPVGEAAVSRGAHHALPTGGPAECDSDPGDSMPVPIAEESAPPAEPGEEATETGLRGILDGETVPGGDGETILFRGRDPRIWNTMTPPTGATSGEAFSIPIADAPDDIGYVRVRRLDTGESVVTPISKTELLGGGSAKARQGWSGRGEQYFGAVHLGLFDESLPREVETKFGAGGWGFGHLESIGSGQAFAWGGIEIKDPGEGFEISVGPANPNQSASAGRPVQASIPASGGGETLSELVERGPAPVPNIAIRPADPGPLTEPDPEELAAQSDNRTSGLVIFRSNDPSLWGREIYFGMNRRARSFQHLPNGLAYLRLRRMDTGEGIVAPVTKAQLTDDGDGLRQGFNGSNESYRGARHLGFFDESLPQEFETRFTFGGWGFGHCVSGPERQASGWEGREIHPSTVFEMAVFRRMPVLSDRDRLLDEA